MPRDSEVRFVILLVVFGLVGWSMARTVRDRVRRSPGLRRHLLTRAAIALILGPIIGLWLPGRVPETPGSPGTMVAMLVLWIIGGGLVLVGVTTMLGLLLARPSAGGPA